MKKYLFLIVTFLSLNSFAADNSYEFESLIKADDYNFSEVLDKKEWSILIFNNGHCPLQRSKIRCFPVEMKLNYFAPKIYARNSNIQIVNIDMQTSFIHNNYFITSTPTVVFLLDGREMIRFDKMRSPDFLVQQVLDEVFKIPSKF